MTVDRDNTSMPFKLTARSSMATMDRQAVALNTKACL